MSYESPITMIYGEIQTRIEDGMLKAVQDVGFNVNKIELQKALMYDRKQYSQGFEDGKKFAEEERGDRMTPKQIEQINLVVGRLQALSCKAETTAEQDILDDCACLLVDVLNPVEVSEEEYDEYYAKHRD